MSQPFPQVKERSTRAWSARMPWDTLYQDVFDYIIPYRRPTSRNVGTPTARIEKIYDNTAVVSAFAGAGRLQHDLFPPGEVFFRFAVGPVAKKALERQNIDVVEANRFLEQISQEVHAFFISGEFDAACLEMCIDLYAGTGALLPIKGDDDDPVRFVCIPSDELAIEPGPYGDIAAIHWKTRMSRSAIRDAFPNGTFPEAFMQAIATNAGAFDEIDLHQSWTRDYKAKRWAFTVWVEGCEVAIATDTMKTQPMAIARYHRVPGEAYGRGPAMLALPTVKTLNKAVELMLKAAAIQMLGLWAYRPGGAFNPATARIAPGAFWPMSSTGGVLGADVTRLDTATARMDVAQLVTQELRMQLQAAMNDDKLPDKGATPVSATEIMARMKRVSQNYLGAFGRLSNEVIPPLVKRVMEILDGFGLLSRGAIPIDALLIKIDVQSPMASMIKAQGLAQVVEFLQLVASLKGPQAIELLIKLDDLLRDMAARMNVPAQFLMTKEEQKELEQKLAAAAAELAAAQTAVAAGPAQPEAVPA
jgi:Trp operon repressor